MLRGSQAPRRAVCGTRGSLRTMHGLGQICSCRWLGLELLQAVPFPTRRPARYSTVFLTPLQRLEHKLESPCTLEPECCIHWAHMLWSPCHNQTEALERQQISLSISNFLNLPKLMSIELVMPSISYLISHLSLCRLLLLLPQSLPASESFPMSQLFA